MLLFLAKGIHASFSWIKTKSDSLAKNKHIYKKDGFFVEGTVTRKFERVSRKFRLYVKALRSWWQQQNIIAINSHTLQATLKWRFLCQKNFDCFKLDRWFSECKLEIVWRGRNSALLMQFNSFLGCSWHQNCELKKKREGILDLLLTY